MALACILCITACIFNVLLITESENVNIFQETMLLNYSPQNPAHFNLYNQTSSLKPTQGIRGVFGSQNQSRNSFEPLCHQPTALPVRQMADLAPQMHQGLSFAVDEIGGIGVFLFLFAKVWCCSFFPSFNVG